MRENNVSLRLTFVSNGDIIYMLLRWQKATLFIAFSRRRTTMKTKAVRIYGQNDLRFEEFELPEMQDDEILAKVISDSVCMSSHKAALQGAAHARVPNDIAQNPTIIGHEFCGEILAVGKKWQHKFKPGDGFAIQPALAGRASLMRSAIPTALSAETRSTLSFPTRLWNAIASSPTITIHTSTVLLQSLFPASLPAITQTIIRTTPRIFIKWG